jgi:hypothetical protein
MLVDGQGNQVLFVGLAPGLVGVYQINFFVPNLGRFGDLPLELVVDSCRALDSFSDCLTDSGKLSKGQARSVAVNIPVR